jgi:hypothetical protein
MMSRNDERWRTGSYDESATGSLGAAVRALEALGKQVDEETLWEAVTGATIDALIFPS